MKYLKNSLKLHTICNTAKIFEFEALHSEPQFIYKITLKKLETFATTWWLSTNNILKQQSNGEKWKIKVLRNSL